MQAIAADVPGSEALASPAMTKPTDTRTPRRGLAAISAGLSMVVILVTVLSLPLGISSELGLSPGETTAWIIAIFGVGGAAALIVALRYRQPLAVTGNIFLILFIGSLGTEFSWPELVGAAVLAGAVVLLLGPLGVMHRLSLWLPSPIVFGLLAGAVLPFVVDVFRELGEAPLLVGITLVVYLLAKRFLEPSVPAILVALVAGLIAAAILGEFGAVPGLDSIATPALTVPQFSLQAIATVMPVMVVLIVVQANIPSTVFLREQGYEPPERVMDLVSGAGSMAGSFLGPTGLSLSLPFTALGAGPDAGDRSTRHWSVYIMAGGAITIALLAGFAPQLATFLPSSLLVAVIGLAVLGLLEQALVEITRGPLRWGPLFAFVIALSGVVIGGFGAFFWAIVGGLLVSLLLERDAWRSLQEHVT